jgi:alpha-1,3-rhamnosyltransferase
MQTPDQDGLPLVSVIIPTYNHEAYVEAAVRSVLAQTYPNVELIVVDDASGDRTPEIVEALSREHGFTFVRNAANMGVNGTAMRAWELSKGAYLGGLASDDMIVPDKIERQVAHLRKTGADGVFATGYKLADDGSAEPMNMNRVATMFRTGSILDHVYCNDTSVPLFQSGLFRREALMELFPYRYKFKSDDWIILIKLLENYRIEFLNEPLFYYRVHEQNSYKRYWATFPMRMEVIANATPERLRGRATANLLLSQAQYLFFDRKRALALRFLVASLTMDPSPARLARLLAAGLKGLGRRGRRKAASLLADRGKRPPGPAAGRAVPPAGTASGADG